MGFNSAFKGLKLLKILNFFKVFKSTEFKILTINLSVVAAILYVY